MLILSKEIMNLDEVNKKYSEMGMNGLTFDMVRNSYGTSQQKQIQKPRYGLAIMVGKEIRCQAIMLPGLRTKAKYNGKELSMRTLININYKGKLVADHIQVNLYGEEKFGKRKWEIDDRVITLNV